MKTGMRRLGLVSAVLVIFLLPTSAAAGGSGPREDESSGAGGGPFIMWKTVSSPGLDRLANSLGVPELGGYLMGVGGGGYSFSGHTRIGGLGASGSLSSTDLVGGVERKLQLGITYGGFLAEYITRYGRSTISFGCLLGGGTCSVKIEEDGSEQKSGKSFFCLEPNFGLRFHLAAFVSLQGWVGYFLVPAEELTIEYDNALYRLKPSEMGGLNVRLMLVFGAGT